MSDFLEMILRDTLKDDRVSEMSSLLRNNPEINVNWRDHIEWTLLHIASFHSHVEVVKLLLAHPNIDVNAMCSSGQTPFSYGCFRGNESVVRVMLKDSRVDITLADNNECTPLWYASNFGHHGVIERLIASGRDLEDVKNKKGMNLFGEEYTALEIAIFKEHDSVVLLLEKFIADPVSTRQEIHTKYGIGDSIAVSLFSLVVFLCDDFLRLTERSLNTTTLPREHFASRFFVIAKKLPMELQMILCHRASNSYKDNVLTQDSEHAFKNLARALLLS